jgi:hypothetical protein
MHTNAFELGSKLLQLPKLGYGSEEVVLLVDETEGTWNRT